MTTRSIRIGRAGATPVSVDVDCDEIITFEELLSRAGISSDAKIMTHDGEVTSSDVVKETVTTVALTAPKIDAGAECDRTVMVGQAGRAAMPITIKAGEIITFGQLIENAGLSSDTKIMTHDGEVTSSDVVKDSVTTVALTAPKIDAGICE